MIPVRCFTCGKVVGNKEVIYKKKVDSGENPAKVLDSIGMTRYCCRRMFLTYVPIIDTLLEYEN